MKKILTLITIAAATFIAAPQAKADHAHGTSTYVSGRTSCGCQVYTQRYVAYYDRCGNPVFSYRTLPVSHHCRPAPLPYNSRNRYNRGYQNTNYTPGYHTGPVIVARPVPQRSCR